MLVPLPLPVVNPGGEPAALILAGILILALGMWALVHIADSSL